MRLFEIRDRSGRMIYMTLERWHHIVEEHSDVVGSFDEIQAAIAYPTAMRRSDEEGVMLYFRYYKYGVSDKNYLLVIVKYLNGEGFVITSYFTDRLQGLP